MVLILLSSLLGVVGLAVGSLWLYSHPRTERVNGHISRNLPPTVIYHGDADTLVPLDQSERFQAAARQRGCSVTLVVHRGGKHGWLSMVWDIRQFADWFDKHLRPSVSLRSQDRPRHWMEAGPGTHRIRAN